jgi:hypothetical protein
VTFAPHDARPLGSNEKAFWRLDEASSLNTAILAHVGPGLDPTRVRAAFASLQARHPLLRARIELRGGQPWFVWPADVEPIPVDVRACDRDAWAEVLEDEMPRWIRWRRAPMARGLVLDHGARGATLAFLAHHTISDGMSGVAAVRDVLWESMTGAPWSPVVHARSRAAESALPERSRGAGGALRRARALVELVGSGRRHRDPVRVPVAREAAPHERTYHIEPRAFDVATTSALTKRARAEQASVHGALGAAMIFGVARLAGLDRARPVTLGSPIDVRARLQPPIGDQLGMYLAVSHYRAVVSPETRLWETARGIRAKIVDDLESGRAIDVLPLIKIFYGAVGGDRASAEEFGRRWAAANGTTGLTNIGKLDVEPPPGLTIERVHAMGFPSGLDVVNAIGSAYGGSLHLTLNWPEPCLDRPTARKLADDIASIVRAAVDGDPTLGP